MGLFLKKLVEDPASYFIWIAVVAFSICVHEYAHARTALKCGDDTAAESGHLTLNPLVQMGPMSLVMLFVIGLAWGAVPVDPSRLTRGQRSLVAFAGPAANLALCAVFGVLAAASQLWFAQGQNSVGYFFWVGSMTNGALFCLNMLPVPALDGWSVLSGFMPGLERIEREHGQTLSWVLFMLIVFTPAIRFVWAGGEGLAGLFVRSAGAVFGVFA